MDTNLKSSREIRTIVTIVILILFAAGIVGSYYVVGRNNIASTVTVEEDIEDGIERMDYSLALETAFCITRSQARWMRRSKWR